MGYRIESLETFKESWSGSSERSSETEWVILGFVHRRLQRVVNDVQERLGRFVGTGRQKCSTKTGTGCWSGSLETFKEGCWNGPSE
jgi:hypothetical protein